MSISTRRIERKTPTIIQEPTPREECLPSVRHMLSAEARAEAAELNKYLNFYQLSRSLKDQEFWMRSVIATLETKMPNIMRANDNIGGKLIRCLEVIRDGKKVPEFLMWRGFAKELAEGRPNGLARSCDYITTFSGRVPGYTVEDSEAELPSSAKLSSSIGSTAHFVHIPQGRRKSDAEIQRDQESDAYRASVELERKHARRIEELTGTPYDAKGKPPEQMRSDLLDAYYAAYPEDRDHQLQRSLLWGWGE